MIRKVVVTQCLCENCDNIVKVNDKFCRDCGKDLQENIVYTEDGKVNRLITDAMCRAVDIAP